AMSPASFGDVGKYKPHFYSLARFDFGGLEYSGRSRVFQAVLSGVSPFVNILRAKKYASRMIWL
ncbi:MAG: hypothetical protein VCF07_12095, partial [Nitrospinota bacterium]